MNPEIYLLDEPSSNLDMTSIQELAEHLRLIKSQGKTILIAEHRLYYLMDLADRIVYLEKGKITNIFTPEEFRWLPQGERERMGLRSVDLQEVLPPTAQPPARKEVLKRGVMLHCTIKNGRFCIASVFLPRKVKWSEWSVTMELVRRHFPVLCVGFIKTVTDNFYGMGSRWSAKPG